MIPDKAIIRVENPDDVPELFEFLDAEGVYWGSLNHKQPLRDFLSTAYHYINKQDKILCYIFESPYRLGYCYEEWFRTEGREYENNFQTWFNYCSPKEFVEYCGGSWGPVSAPDVSELL